MEIKRCFEMLELDRSVSIDEARQAYKDMVDVWHPDRFSHNPRLRQKAEEKLKELNIAYETVKAFLCSKQEEGQEKEEVPDVKYKAQAKSEARDKTEIAAEAGTRIILNVCSYFLIALRRLVVGEAAHEETEAESKEEPGNPNQ